MIVRYVYRDLLPIATKAVDVSSWLRQNFTHALVAADVSASDIDYWKIMESIDRNHGCMRLVLIAWLNKYLPINANTVDRVTVGLLREDLRGSRKLAFYLGAVSKVSLAFPRDDAAKILRRSLYLSGQPINPYAPNSEIISAREAAVSVLYTWPHLDDDVLSQLRENPSQRDSLVSILALVSHRRAEQRAETFTKTVTVLRPSAVERMALADKFAWHTTIPVKVPEAPSMPMAARRRLRRLAANLPAVVVLLGGGALALLAWHNAWSPPPAPVGLAEAVPLLALLVTANVFTVTLSNSRLPGRISRATSQGWQLKSAYTAALVLLVVSLIQPQQPGLLTSVILWTNAWLLLAFVISIVLLVPRILANTDQAAAAARYLSLRVDRARSAGIVLGRLQAAAIYAKNAFEQQDNIRIDVDAGHPPRSIVITSRHRGLFSPSPARLLHIMGSSAVPQGASLVLVKPIGSVVNSGDTLALMQPASDSVLSQRFARRATAVLQPRRIESIDQVSRDCAALAGLTFKLADEGDLSAAAIVAPYSADLLRHFLHSARSTRARHVERLVDEGRVLAEQLNDQRVALSQDDHLRIPVTAPVRAFTGFLYERVLKAGDASSDPARIVASKVIAGSDISDGVVLLTAFALEKRYGGVDVDASAHYYLARLAGMRALELNDAIAWSQILLVLGQRPGEQSLGAIAALAAASAAYRRALWVPAFDKYERVAVAGSSDVTDMFIISGYCLVGAAALHAGNLSGAVRIVDIAVSKGFVATLVRMNSRDVIPVLALRARASGVALGASPEDAFANFIEFAGTLLQ